LTPAASEKLLKLEGDGGPCGGFGVAARIGFSLARSSLVSCVLALLLASPRRRLALRRCKATATASAVRRKAMTPLVYPDDMVSSGRDADKAAKPEFPPLERSVLLRIGEAEAAADAVVLPPKAGLGSDVPFWPGPTEPFGLISPAVPLTIGPAVSFRRGPADPLRLAVTLKLDTGVTLRLVGAAVEGAVPFTPGPADALKLGPIVAF
jgi:hypothetical protein